MTDTLRSSFVVLAAGSAALAVAAAVCLFLFRGGRGRTQ